MLKVSNVDVSGWRAAIRGMRNPMNSWEKSDSYISDCDSVSCKDCPYIACAMPNSHQDSLDLIPVIGPNDLDLMKRLAKAGKDHRKFARMIHVSMDICAPLYLWKELDTYKVGTVANSCSTMHKIAAKEFTLDDFSHEHLKEDGIDILRSTVRILNKYRELYMMCPNELAVEKKEYWWQMIQLLPTTYNQLRTVDLNYEVLANIYFARRNHKLDEWHTFCDEIEKLPYFMDIFGIEKRNNEVNVNESTISSDQN